MAEHMRTDLICDAITMAATNVELSAGAIFHSDRGTQYTSAQFAEHLQQFDITGSMGRTGVCWDNAMAESFFAALKNELVHRTVFTTREKARRAMRNTSKCSTIGRDSTPGWTTRHPWKSPTSISKTAQSPRNTANVTVRKRVTLSSSAHGGGRRKDGNIT